MKEVLNSLFIGFTMIFIGVNRLFLPVPIREGEQHVKEVLNSLFIGFTCSHKGR